MQFRLAILTLLILCCSPLSVFAVETKDIKFPIKDATPVTFSHEFHLKKYNNNCKVCHNAIFNLRDKRHFTMAEMEKTKSCGACHSGVKAFSVADSKSCVRCHKGTPRQLEYKAKNAGTVTFNHTFHVGKLNSDCKACHNANVITGKDGHVTMAEMEKGKTCGACHNGKQAFLANSDCNKCHKGFKPGQILFKTEIGNAKFSHQIHLNMFKCTDCHTKIFPYSTTGKRYTMHEMEKGKSCGACHDGKEAFTVSGNCENCHK